MSDNIKFGSGFNGCEDRMKILQNSVVQRELKEFEEIESSESKPETFLYVDHEGQPSKIRLDSVINASRVKSDFAETNPESDAFIKNKDMIPGFVNSILDKELVSLYTIGGIKAGDRFPAGTTLLDIIKELLSVSSGAAFRFGVVDQIPTSVEVLPERQERISDLLAFGFEVNGLSLNNQYFILALPDTMGIEVSSILQGGFALSYVTSKINNWTLYYSNVKSTGTFSIKYTFKEKVGA